MGQPIAEASGSLNARGVFQRRGSRLRSSSLATSGRERRHSIQRMLLPPDRLPHFQVDLPASYSVAC
jgi:hypothetical protein